MSVGTFIWLMILLIIFCDLILCTIYSIFRRHYELKREAKKKNAVNKMDIPLGNTNKLKRIISKIDKTIYGLCRYTSIVIGRVPSHTIRKILFKYVFCMQIDKRAIIHGGCEVRSPWNIKIGNSVIGVGAILDGRNGIEIEDDVVLATGVWIWTEQHDAQDPYFRCLDKGGKVIIKAHSWIGNRVSVLPKVVIGEGCVVASGAVVTKSCESYYMYGGIPAKIINDRNKDLRYTNVTNGVWSIY